MSSVNVAPPRIADPACVTSPRPDPAEQDKGLSVKVQTMGCKVNLFESELIQHKLGEMGYQRSGQVEDASVYIINTCTVTGEADRQARQQVRKAIRTNPDAWVVVTGCYAQVAPETCADIPGVDLVVGNSRKLDIPSLLEPLYKQQLPAVMVDDIDQEISLPDELVSGFEGRTRAFVQIQQGCDQGCTFCIIHTARGPNRSFSPALIKRQVQRLVMNNYAEIVICGVDIGSYGSDFKAQFSLAELLCELVELEGDFRLRLSSIDPAHLSDDLIRVMASSDKICPQLHLSMQSGNTLILKRMKRRATREVLYERIQALKAAVPDLVLSADVMVGFPTEGDAHFSETLEAIDDLDIAFPHVFSYSPRPGTPAARIPKQVPGPVRKQRAAIARETGKRVWQRIAGQLVGSRQRILVESAGAENHPEQNTPDRGYGGDRQLIGRAGNYFKVITSAESASANHWQEVEITGFGNDALFARKCC